MFPKIVNFFFPDQILDSQKPEDKASDSCVKVVRISVGVCGLFYILFTADSAVNLEEEEESLNIL